MQATKHFCKYDEISSNIKPFDLIGFKGGDFVSRIIMKLEEEELGMGEFSHVGMVVTNDILKKAGDFILEPNKKYIFESTYSYKFQSDGVSDISTNKGMFGVQLRDFDEIIKHYNSTGNERIAWCKLINNPYDLPANRKMLKKIFTKFFNYYHNTTYDISAIDLISSLVSPLRFIREIKDDVTDSIFEILKENELIDNKILKPSELQFCSELIANVYREIGVISTDINPKDVVPMDFFGCDKDGLNRIVSSPVYIDIYKN